MSTTPPSTSSFPLPYIINPISAHKHTIVALHGLNSTGEIFANRLVLSQPHRSSESSPPTFQPWLNRLLPALKHTRLIFPTAPLRTITNPAPVPRTVHAWFEISSFTDLELDQEIQIPGLRGSVDHVHQIIDEEVVRLEAEGRGARDLFLLGRSQGSSVTGWTVLTRLKEEIGGVVLGGSWLVMARALEKAVLERKGGSLDEGGTINVSVLEFARRMVRDGPILSSDVISKVPTLMGHSTDDQWISLNLGRQFRDVLTAVGVQVEWNEYCGADEEGHWFKEPEEFEDIVNFLVNHMKP